MSTLRDASTVTSSSPGLSGPHLLEVSDTGLSPAPASALLPEPLAAGVPPPMPSACGPWKNSFTSPISMMFPVVMSPSPTSVVSNHSLCDPPWGVVMLSSNALLSSLLLAHADPALAPVGGRRGSNSLLISRPGDDADMSIVPMSRAWGDDPQTGTDGELTRRTTSSHCCVSPRCD